MAAKFKVGDRVKCRGRDGTVVEVVGHGGAPVYSVRCESWKKTEHVRNPESGEWTHHYENPHRPGEFRDHEADTLGAVLEDELTKGQ